MKMKDYYTPDDIKNQINEYINKKCSLEKKLVRIDQFLMSFFD